MDFPAFINDNDLVPAQRAGSRFVFDPKFYGQETSNQHAVARRNPGQ